jgi:uncharacterized tellurite resistance protein B-like protein
VAIVRTLLCNFETLFEVVICTGRSEQYRNVTEAWLKANGLFVDVILMRQEHDHSETNAMKFELLENYFGSKEEVLNRVLLVLEDRDKSVEGFRNYGIPCWQVREGVY